MILYGKPLAQKIIDELKTTKTPSGKFVVVQVGADQISDLYVAKKQELAKEVGIDFELVKLDGGISFGDFKEKLVELNCDQGVRAILVQIPLPPHIDRVEVAKLIDPKKDVDGFNYILGQAKSPVPPTVVAVNDLLDFYDISLTNKKILVVGWGFLVGKPLYRFYSESGLDVDILKRGDADYRQKLQSADIVITATGRGGIFSYDDFKQGAIIIDASTISEGGVTRGDVDLTSWPDSVSVAPVPGGVGPVTVAELIKNFYLL